MDSVLTVAFINISLLYEILSKRYSDHSFFFPKRADIFCSFDVECDFLLHSKTPSTSMFLFN